MTMPTFDGWHPVGRYPRGDPDGVGSWLLHNGGEAMLLEVPPGLTVTAVRRGLRAVGCHLTFASASHLHEDHFDADAWTALRAAFGGATFLRPVKALQGARQLDIGGEPAWLLQAPKHSWRDVVTVFRGVAMTGDVETGTVDSVNPVVPIDVRRASMAYLAGFEQRTGYHVHTAVSAHVNSVHVGVDWAGLFNC